MTRIQYEDWNPRGRSLAMVATANSICEEYAAQGYDLTLRQLYYQFVARDLIENSQRSYKNLGNIVNKARLAGLLSWDYIVDRTRNLEELASWRHPRNILSSSALQFKLDHWKDQPNYVEVWIEKDALIGVIERACNELDVPYFSCRGYTSQSEMWRASQRLNEKETWIDNEQSTYIIHLGDHDPSGIDMTRDIQDRLYGFGSSVYVNRVALNMDQIEDLNPPPNPTKLTDARAQQYVNRFGHESWELDALEPRYLNDLITNEVTALRDDDIYAETIAKEEDYKSTLTSLAQADWTDIKEFAS